MRHEVYFFISDDVVTKDALIAKQAKDMGLPVKTDWHLVKDPSYATSGQREMVKKYGMVKPKNHYVAPYHEH